MFLHSIKGYFTVLSCLIVSFSQINVSEAAGFIPDRNYYETRGDIIWEVPTKEKMIALTFDDGPNDTYTPEVLDILNEYHAKATFFLIGEHIKQFPNLARREVLEGHEIENHTFTHVVIEKMSDQEYLADISKTDKLIQTFQTSPLRLFRPPKGHLSASIIKALRKDHYEIVLWSWHQDTRDWERPGVNRIANHVIKNAHNGDIVIMHDSGGNREQTVKALKIILPTLEKQGYQFVTIRELLESCPKYKFLFK